MRNDLTRYHAKSIIIKTYGYESPRVETAVIRFIKNDHKEEENHDFNNYFQIYRLAARAARLMDKEKFLNSNSRSDEYLIHNFIDNAHYKEVATTLNDLLCKLVTRNKDGVAWMEFEELIEKEMYRSMISEKNSKKELL